MGIDGLQFRLQPTQIALGKTQSATDLLKLDYSYGSTANNGNVLTQDITVTRVGLSPLVFNQTYTYDSLNRLKVAEEKTGTTTNWKQTFTFDRYGNRNFDHGNTSEPNSFAYPNITDPTVNAANNKFDSGQGWSYDAAGNVTTDAKGNTFTFDAENKQVEAKNSVATTLGTYYFDGDGKRVKKVVPSGETTIFVYDAAGKSIAEYSTTPSSTPQVQYLTNDNLGTPRINTDRDGNVNSRSDYMPYGEEIVALGGRSSTDKYVGDDVRQGFTGYERDNESDLDYAQARYYQFQHGRFTSIDPIMMAQNRLSDPQQINLYVYVRNNPLMFTDPTGQDAQGRSEDANGNPTALTEEDRKRLEKELRRLAPGTRVNADGTVRKAGFWQRVANRLTGHGVGQELVSGLVNSRQTTTIVVSAGNTGTDFHNETNASNGVGSDATVYWNPNQTNPASWMVQRGPGEEYTANGAVAFPSRSAPAIVLAHELIHALHIASGTASFDDTPSHDFVVRSGNTYYVYRESSGGDPSAPPSREEFRTVGFHPFAGRREVTENRIRRELNIPLRVSYFAAPSPYWNCVSCP